MRLLIWGQIFLLLLFNNDRKYICVKKDVLNAVLLNFI